MFLVISYIRDLLKNEDFGEYKWVELSKKFEDTKSSFEDFVNEIIDPKKRRKRTVEFQKEYHGVISRLFSWSVKTANEMNLTYERDDISFVNMLNPDFSWVWKGEYRITEDTDWVKMGYFCSLLSKLAFERTKNIQSHLQSWVKGDTSEIEFYEPIRCSHVKHDTFCFILKFRHINIFYIVFRGTKAFSPVDWETDFDYVTINPLEKRPDLFMGSSSNDQIDVLKNVQVHRGFFEALFEKGIDAESMYEKIRSLLINDMNYEEGKSLVVTTGHSMGGALSAIFSAFSHILYKNHQEKDKSDKPSNFSIYRSYTFGSPRIGNLEYAKLFHHKTYRYVNDLDVVTAVPQWLHHQGQEILLSKYNTYGKEKKDNSYSFLKRLRENLPLVSYSVMDHYPHCYVENIAKENNYIHGNEEWQRFSKGEEQEEDEGEEVEDKYQRQEKRILELRKLLEEEKQKVMRLENQLKKE